MAPALLVPRLPTTCPPAAVGPLIRWCCFLSLRRSGLYAWRISFPATRVPPPWAPFGWPPLLLGPFPADSSIWVPFPADCGMADSAGPARKRGHPPSAYSPPTSCCRRRLLAVPNASASRPPPRARQVSAWVISLFQRGGTVFLLLCRLLRPGVIAVVQWT